MVLGKVTERLAVTRSLPGYEQIQWVRVNTPQGVYVAADPLKSEKGDLVLLGCDGVARARSMECLADAMVIALVEENGNCG